MIACNDREILAMMDVELQLTQSDLEIWGEVNPHMICPHCQTKGSVQTKFVLRKMGISGAKATGALLTGGFSLLFTGLSREEEFTQAHCLTCDSVWHF